MKGSEGEDEGEDEGEQMEARGLDEEKSETKGSEAKCKGVRSTKFAFSISAISRRRRSTCRLVRCTTAFPRMHVLSDTNVSVMGI